MQTGNKKMCDLRTGDVFVRDDFTYVAIADPYYGTVWVTTPEFVNEEEYTATHRLLCCNTNQKMRQKSSVTMSVLRRCSGENTLILMERNNPNATLLARSYHPVPCSVCHGRKEGMWEDQRSSKEPGSSG